MAERNPRTAEQTETRYGCAACGALLFTGAAKFDAGTGFPSFDAPAGEACIRTVERRSHGVHRTQVCCASCGAHLGHVFADDDRPAGRRYCIARDVLAPDA